MHAYILNVFAVFKVFDCLTSVLHNGWVLKAILLVLVATEDFQLVWTCYL